MLGVHKALKSLTSFAGTQTRGGFAIFAAHLRPLA